MDARRQHKGPVHDITGPSSEVLTQPQASAARPAAPRGPDVNRTFLREVGAGIADGRIRHREDLVEGLERAPEAFIGMLEEGNFGKLIVRVDG
jgi:NADPH:quinone reductase-like Zn-dependent oxidoreductase